MSKKKSKESGIKSGAVLLLEQQQERREELERLKREELAMFRRAIEENAARMERERLERWTSPSFPGLDAWLPQNVPPRPVPDARFTREFPPSPNTIFGIERPEPPPPLPTPEETKTAFAALLAASGVKKVLPLVDRVKHELELGYLEEVKAKQGVSDAGAPKRLCGVCGDPLCPWSD